MKKLYITSLEAFIEAANIVHANKYDYSLAEYKSSHNKINIICPIHGVFRKSSNAHVSLKQGCPKCSKAKVEHQRMHRPPKFNVFANHVAYNGCKYPIRRVLLNRKPFIFAVAELKHVIFKDGEYSSQQAERFHKSVSAYVDNYFLLKNAPASKLISLMQGDSYAQ